MQCSQPTRSLLNCDHSSIEGITIDEMKDLLAKTKTRRANSFTELTRLRLLRHATFHGLLDDKAPAESCASSCN